VAILGAPNAGKSTLLNRMLGQKLSITSKKPQTTRNRILGVVHRTGSQMVFLDTPGIHGPSTRSTRIVDAALSTLSEADLVLLVADAQTPDESVGTAAARQARPSAKVPGAAGPQQDRPGPTAGLCWLIERWSGVILLQPWFRSVPKTASRWTG
jgi:small GTP-binding protein